jgi:hypothetical protein
MRSQSNVEVLTGNTAADVLTPAGFLQQCEVVHKIQRSCGTLYVCHVAKLGYDVGLAWLYVGEEDVDMFDGKGQSGL